MYESFFRIQRRPFAAAPATDLYYAAPSTEAARQAVARAIERAAGSAVILGAAGTGKTLLLALLAQEFADRFEVVQLSGRLRSVKALLQNILFELKLPFRDLTEGELRLSLLDRLEPRDRARQGLLLLIDEAHVLPAKLLDELRMITNLVRGGEPRVRLVLAGDVRLEERLANPRLASFQQRIAARCYLSPLAREETAALVRHELTVAGLKPQEIIDDAALAAVQRVTDGVPRLINQVCDHALILAAVAGERRLTAARIEEAWNDLQQLPAPKLAVLESANDERASIIEFGSLATSATEFGALDETTTPGGDRVTRIDGPTRPRRDPLSQLDDIERHLAAAQDDDFDPLASLPSEIELSFAGPSSPFGGVFAEEEVVIDRYASLEAQTLKNSPRVSSTEGRAIATLLGTVVGARRQLGIVSDDEPLVRGESLARSDIAAEAFDDPFDPAADPVLPEYPGVSTNVAAAQPELVVVDTQGDAHRTSSEPPPGRAHRQEYRQLFAKLRRGG